MNKNMIAYWEDFNNTCKGIDSTKAAVMHLAEYFGVDQEELETLSAIVSSIIETTFSVKVLKKNNYELYYNMFALLMTTYFFGMYVSDIGTWVWPSKV
jgi:hypothetical protein